MQNVCRQLVLEADNLARSTGISPHRRNQAMQLRPCRFPEPVFSLSLLMSSVPLAPVYLVNFRVRFTTLEGFHIRRTSPASVARVLRTSSKTTIMPTNGTKPTTTTIGSNDVVACAARSSEK